MAVGDAAILLRSCQIATPPKTRRVSFIPHWESAIDGEWAEVCRAAEVHYIDPCADVERVIADIVGSELVVTEAMHGAIVADALRVPWVPVRPIQTPNRMKWLDWASALNIDLRSSPIASSNALEWALGLTGNNRRWAGRLRRRAQQFRHIASSAFKERAATSLMRLSKGPVHLSSDAAMESAHTRMLEELERLQSDFQ
jgi:succinoglycan biosynthesis protein ExoV